ncbi:MAG TPA: Yip1 family protein [Gammaproteobacteria bacterium]|nr:Yip1 family protein [Gammaproteobacteria bacterium]
MEFAKEVSRRGLVDRVRNIIVQPRSEWEVIAAEPATVQSLYRNYIMLLAAIGPVCSIVGNTLVGQTVPIFNIHYRVPLGSSIAYAVVAYALTLAGVYVVALIIDWLAPTFGGVRNRTQALKVSAYSMTPGWIIAAVALYPPLGILRLLGVYGLFLLYLGLPPLMQAPRERSVGYAVATIVAAIVVYLIIGAVAGMTISGPSFPTTPQ